MIEQPTSTGAVPEFVLIIDRLKLYGAERVCADLAGVFAQHTPTTLVTYGEDATPSVVLSEMVERLRLASSRFKPVSFFQVVFGIRRVLRVRPDALIVCFMPLANILTLIATLGMHRRIIVTEHNLPSRILRGGTGAMVLRFAARVLYRRASVVVCVSESVRNDLLKEAPRLPPSMTRVIYNPVDVARLKRQLESDQRPSIRVDDSSLPLGARIILIVGALKHAKGHDVAIRALSRMPEDCHLVFMGDGPVRKDLERLGASLRLSHRLHFLGARSAVAAAMRGADLVLVPSRYEGFGLVAVEAAAVGANVLVADSPGLSEVGALLGVPTVALEETALAAAMKRLVLRPSEAVKEDNFATFDPYFVARQYAELYNMDGLS